MWIQREWAAKIELHDLLGDFPASDTEVADSAIAHVCVHSVPMLRQDKHGKSLGRWNVKFAAEY